MFQTIKCGDRVTICTRHGQTQIGRAIMFNVKVGAWVLNLGGHHGTPGLATEANTIAVKRGKRDGFTATAEILNGRGV